MPNIKLLPHQEEAKRRLKNQHGLILSWEVGSGKTLGAIAAADQFGSTSVVVPASLRENFKHELKTFKSKNKFEVKSYERFVKDKEDLSNKTVIFDEAHALKTPDSQRSRSAQKLSRQAKKVVLLSGTPIQDKPSDVSSLVNIAAGHQVLPSSRKAFDEKYLTHIKTDPGIILRTLGFKKRDEYVPKNLNDFAAKAKPYFMNYTPAESSDAPKVRHFNVDVQMSPTQQAVYHVLEKQLPGDLRKSIEESLPAGKKNISTLNRFLSATRQVSNSSDKFYSPNGKEYSPKLLNIAKIVSKSPGKSLIYSDYLESGVTPLSELLTAKEIKHGIFTGGMNDKDRKKLVSDYNANKLKALIVSSAGGQGLSLKGTRSVHIANPYWNNEKINQVVGRAIRLNSHTHLPLKDRTVDVYKYRSVLPEQRSGFLWMNKTRPISTDQYLENVSDKKQKLNKAFLDVLK
jgi:SNF2 family DNA or RNA helicase